MNRVLLISNYKPGTGGISGQVEILLKKLREEGFVAEVFNTKGSIWYRISLFNKLRKIVDGFDVLHIHCCSGWGFLPAVVGVFVGRRLKKRVVLTYHGGGAETFFAKHQRMVKNILSRTDQNIVLSGFLGGVFDKYDIPYVTIPNIIELDGSRFRLRERLKPDFICIRTLDPLYNHECILKAFEIVKRQLPEATLTLVGGGTIRKELEEKVEVMGLKDVTFVGRVDNSQIYGYLDHADIMLSAPHVDNMPVSLLEGFNAGLLVISSRVGGVPYMVEDGVNGLLFEDDDFQGLAGKMMWGCEHRNEANSIVINAKEMVIRYSWVHIKDSLLDCYGFRS